MENFDLKRTAMLQIKESKLFTEEEMDFLINWMTTLPDWDLTSKPCWSPSKAGEVLGGRSANNIQQWCKTMGIHKDLTGNFWMITAADLIRMKEKANELDNRK